jgi:hypothetical protein
MRNVSFAMFSLACVLASLSARAQAPTSSQAKVLHLMAPHIVIDQPGMYVLDRNWSIPGPGAIIEITADNVVFDLRGFSIEMPSDLTDLGVSIRGDNVTVRNGRIVTSGSGGPTVIASAGASTVIDTVQMESTLNGLNVIGFDAVVRNSSLKARRGISALAFRYLIEGNRVDCIVECVEAGGDRGVIRGNHLYREVDTGSHSRTLTVSGTGNTVENNYLENVDNYPSAIVVQGVEHVIANNTLIVTRGFDGGPAILLESGASGNVINGNVASHSARGSRLEFGILFSAGSFDNFFGGNRMEAFDPFVLSNTSQVDWGDNVGY